MTETRLDARIRGVFLLFATVLAALTAWTHLSQVIGISFRIYCIVSLMVSVLIAAAVVYFQIPRLRAARSSDSNARLLILAMVVVGGILAITSHRPDADDLNYVPNMIYYLENPDAAMGFEVHYVIRENDVPITTMLISTALPFDYAQGVLAWLTGLPYMAIRYLAFTLFLGCLLPLAWFYVISRFSDSERRAAVGTLFIFAIILLLGETHRVYGNYTFNRIYQGKVVFMTMMVPVFAGVAVDFFRRRDRASWWLLFVIAVSCVGLASTSVPMLPVLAGLLLGAHWVASWPNKPEIKFSLVYLASLAYVFVYGALILAHAYKYLSVDSILHSHFPTSFSGHMLKMFSGTPPVSAIAVVGFTLLALILTRGYTQKFFLGWSGLAVLLVLNPLVAPFYVEHVTSPTVYWRLLYIYPFPIAIGLTVIALLHRYEEGKGVRIGMALALAATILLHFVPYSTSIFQRSGTKLDWPKYEVNHEMRALSQEVLSVAPKGNMLAPLRLSVNIPMVKSDYKQLVSRPQESRLWMSNFGGDLETAEKRLNAVLFAGGMRETYEDFVEVLDNYAIQTVVMKQTVFAKENVKQAVLSRGYQQTAEIQDVVVLINPKETQSDSTNGF